MSGINDAHSNTHTPWHRAPARIYAEPREETRCMQQEGCAFIASLFPSLFFFFLFFFCHFLAFSRHFSQKIPEIVTCQKNFRRGSGIWRGALELCEEPWNLARSPWNSPRSPILGTEFGPPAPPGGALFFFLLQSLSFALKPREKWAKKFSFPDTPFSQA